MSDAAPQRAPEPSNPSNDEVGARVEPVSPTPFVDSEPPLSEFFGKRPPVVSVPLDLRTPLRWLDLVLLGAFYIVSGAVLYMLVSEGAFLAFGISPRILQQSVAARSVILIVSQALLSGATLLFLFVLLRGRSVEDFWPALGWRRFRGAVSAGAIALQYAFGGFALALLVGFLSRFVGNDSGLPMEEMFRSRLSIFLMMALGILVAPFVEETVFRGCIYPVIARRFGLRAGVIATGLLFGLAHAQQLWGGWGQIALLAGVGILLTYIRAETGTVAASYFVHLGYNTTLFAGFYFATGGLHYIPS